MTASVTRILMPLRSRAERRPWLGREWGARALAPLSAGRRCPLDRCRPGRLASLPARRNTQSRTTEAQAGEGRSPRRPWRRPVALPEPAARCVGCDRTALAPPAPRQRATSSAYRTLPTLAPLSSGRRPRPPPRLTTPRCLRATKPKLGRCSTPHPRARDTSEQTPSGSSCARPGRDAADARALGAGARSWTAARFGASWRTCAAAMSRGWP